MSNFENDDFLLKEKFQKNYQEVKLPSDLKDAVRSEMKKEAHRMELQSAVGATTVQQSAAVQSANKKAEPNKNKQKRKLKIWQIGAAGAAVCAAALAFLVLKPAGVSYVTPMEDGIYYDTVELKDGEIHFVKNRVAISITPNAGNVTIGGANIEETGDGQKKEVLEEIETESGGVLLFQEAGLVSLPEIAEENWSNIGDCMIYVTVLKTEEIRYQAVFELKGSAYQIIGTDVTQKEFIDYLYVKIKE